MRAERPAASLHDRAEELAGKLSVRQLTADEAAEAVDIIFDLLKEQNREPAT